MDKTLTAVQYPIEIWAMHMNILDSIPDMVTEIVNTLCAKSVYAP
jgi:hypothetical protein